MNKKLPNSQKKTGFLLWKNVGRAIFIVILASAALYFCSFIFRSADIGPPTRRPFSNLNVMIVTLLIIVVEWELYKAFAEEISEKKSARWFYLSMGTIIMLVLVFLVAYLGMHLVWGATAEWPSLTEYVILLFVSLTISASMFGLTIVKVLKED